MKSLLGLVLNAREQTNSDLFAQNGLMNSIKLRQIQVQGQNAEQTALKKSSTMGPQAGGAALASQLTLAAQSGGFQAGNFARIDVSRDGHGTAIPGIFGRGLNIAVLDPLDGSILETGSFDTHISPEESDEFAKMIEWLEPGMIVVVVAKDDCTEHLTEAAKLACESLGSCKVRELTYRDSWCLIGEKGAERGSVPEAHRRANAGPTETIHRIIDLNARRKKLFADLPTNATNQLLASAGAAAAIMLPSSGRWLRRRKNDGALNRVPPEFYPKVWKVLSKCHGIQVGREFLPRDPTISEKTPEEFNFALQVESLLDVIRDPAERQIAVECLVVIARIGERNPEIQIHSGTLDLLRIIRDAVQRHWQKWVSEGKVKGPIEGSTLPPPIFTGVPSPTKNAAAGAGGGAGAGTAGDGVGSPAATSPMAVVLEDTTFERNER
ncbi:Phosphorylase b kinase regulatory subunit alpha, partial [Quaeritorhiza haematococci]